MLAGGTAHPALRQPILGSIRSGILCAATPLSKNSARKSSREDTNYTNPHEFAKRGKRFSFAHETHELTRIKKSDSREVSATSSIKFFAFPFAVIRVIRGPLHWFQKSRSLSALSV
jgi:nucleoside diphosphate kinase